jgi:large subunit ribosomal protein L3
MSGIIGNKLGMTQIFDDSGNVIGVTVIQAGPCQVTQVKTSENDGYIAIQLLFGGKKREFRLANSGEYKVGQELKVDQFKAGDTVKISGKTVGKGFAGVVKRFHDHRGPMTHGSKSHRIPGSSGSGTTPGRVWPGRHMPGRLGGGMASIKRTEIVQIDAENNLVMVRGSVPGKKGNLVLIKKV